MAPAAAPSIAAAHAFAALSLLERATRRTGSCEAAETLALAREAVAAPRRRRRTGALPVPAGTLVEVLPGPSAGSPQLTPAPGSVAGLDEARSGITVYRALTAGVIGGRAVAEGARILVGRRAIEPGDLVVVASRRSIKIAAADRRGRVELPLGGRIVGVVEGVIAEGGAERRCA